MVPSLFIISQITADGLRLASMAKSIEASVCPALTKTPPFSACNGKICPGETRFFLSRSGLIAISIVFALS